MEEAPKTRVRLDDGRVLTLDAKPGYVRRWLMGPGDVLRNGERIDTYTIVEVLDD